MSGSVCKNFDTFGRFCGDKVTERVRLVTMWDKARDHDMAESRLAQLENNFWQPLIEKEARHKKFNNIATSTWEIINDVVGDAEALLLQKELVDVERMLNETTAGKALYTQFQKLLREQKETIKKLSDETKAEQDPTLARDLEIEYQRIEVQIQKTWEEMEQLKIPFLRRISLFFSKRPRSVSIPFLRDVRTKFIHGVYSVQFR